MPLFRRQRGTLEESLKTTIIVRNMEELKNAILEDLVLWHGLCRKDGTRLEKTLRIEISSSCIEMDTRCGWYTQIVSANIDYEDHFYALGYLSEPFTKENK